MQSLETQFVNNKSESVRFFILTHKYNSCIYGKQGMIRDLKIKCNFKKLTH